MKPIAKPVLRTAPTGLAADLTQTKSFLKVEGSDEDTLITALIKAVTERLETETGLKFITQKWDIYYDHFPSKPVDDWWDGVRDGALSQLYTSSDTIDLPFGRLNSIAAFKTIDESDTEYTFAASNYSLDTTGPFGRIGLKIGQVWPQTILKPFNGIKIEEATFGFGATYLSVPEAIQQAIKMTVAKLYENRGDNSSGESFGTQGFTIPNTAMVLLGPYLRHRIR